MTETQPAAPEVVSIAGSGSPNWIHRVVAGDYSTECVALLERWAWGRHVLPGYCSRPCPCGRVFRTEDFPADRAEALARGEVEA